MERKGKREDRFPLRATARDLLIGVLVVAMALGVLGYRVAHASGVIAATVRPNPLTVTVSSIPSEVAVGRRFAIEALVENQGSGSISDVVATIHYPDPGLILDGDAAQSLEPSTEHGTARWELVAGKVGNYVIVVVVTGQVASDYPVECEGSTLVEVKHRLLFLPLVLNADSGGP